jgi:hypothetical protein
MDRPDPFGRVRPLSCCRILLGGVAAAIALAARTAIAVAAVTAVAPTVATITPLAAALLAALARPAGADLLGDVAPVAWSTTRMESFTLPRSSKPMTLTFTWSPSLTCRWSCSPLIASSEMWTRPSLAPRKFNEGAELGGLHHLAVVDLAHLGSATMPVIQSIAFCAARPWWRRPWRCRRRVDVDLGAGGFRDLADHLAAGAMTSRILSLLMLITVIRGAVAASSPRRR